MEGGHRWREVVGGGRSSGRARRQLCEKLLPLEMRNAACENAGGAESPLEIHDSRPGKRKQAARGFSAAPCRPVRGRAWAQRTRVRFTPSWGASAAPPRSTSCDDGDVLESAMLKTGAASPTWLVSARNATSEAKEVSPQSYLILIDLHLNGHVDSAKSQDTSQIGMQISVCTSMDNLRREPRTHWPPRVF